MGRSTKGGLLRVRVTKDMKQDIEAWCIANDLTLSQVFRAMIRAHLANPNRLYLELAGRKSLPFMEPEDSET